MPSEWRRLQGQSLFRPCGLLGSHGKDAFVTAAFSQETFDFLGALAANNTRDWFEGNRDAYERGWKRPALDFIADVSGEMSRLDPPLRAEPRLNGSLRRINRDTRFSSDKTPYSPRLHLVFWAGNHPNRSPGLHVVLQPDGVGFGAGMWGLDKARLDRFRARVLDNGDRAALLAALARARARGCSMDPPELARLPRGFADVPPEADALLRHKSVVSRSRDTVGTDVLTGAGAAEWVLALARDMLPLIGWLKPLAV